MGEFISWCCSTINYYITCSCCSDPPKCQKCGLCKRCCCKCDDNDDKNIPLLIKNEINEKKEKEKIWKLKWQIWETKIN